MKPGNSDRDRFERMKRIDWLNLESIHKTRCLVVGAGALGNEAVKCMVLAGFRNIVIVDMDDIVISNLSRCLFFRENDEKSVMKADILAERASDLDSSVHIISKVCRVEELENWNFDLILGCLDNVAARLHVNSHARYYGIPYVDGATDGFRGRVQTVLKTGACLQCAMNRSHMKILNMRFTCTGRDTTVYRPHIAAEITTTSIIAAMIVREGMKIASFREDLCIKGITFYNGTEGTMETLSVETDPSCPNHEGD